MMMDNTISSVRAVRWRLIFNSLGFAGTVGVATNNAQIGATTLIGIGLVLSCIDYWFAMKLATNKLEKENG